MEVEATIPYSSVSGESHSVASGSGSGTCNELTPSSSFPTFTSNINYNDYFRLRTKEETQIGGGILSSLQDHINASEKTSSHKTKATSAAEWKFLLAGLCLEIISLALDQVSSPTKPSYALCGLLFAFAALVLCLWELIHKDRKERAKLKRVGMRWFHDHPRSFYAVLGSTSVIYGLVGGISQCVCSIVQYVFFLRHGDNPIKASLLPAVFLICLAAKRLISNPRYASE
ncbi:PREDICTED: uncharacterized protein LOC101303688 [Fragaria vesca subsp. vesca]